MNMLSQYDSRLVELEIKPHPLSLIFPEMSQDEFEKLKEDISGNGVYNPIYYVIADGNALILDGRHRYRACMELGIDPIAYMVPWQGPGADHEFVISQNILRRHLNDSDLAMCAGRALDWFKEQAKKRQVESKIGNTHAEKTTLPQEGKLIAKPTAEETSETTHKSEPFHAHKLAGEKFGVGKNIVQNAEVVLTRGNQNDIAEVDSGISTVTKKAKEIRNREKIQSEKPELKTYITLDEYSANPDLSGLVKVTDAKFNKQDNLSIDWAKWSWNPVTGCKHECPYCYARDIANRFYDQKFEPSFIPSRLHMPGNTKVPANAEEDIAYKNVFTCSMADLFGRWVPDEWINSIFDCVSGNPQWNFLFLTKFPKRMVDFNPPANAWLGTTIDCQARVKAAEDAFENLTSGVKWLSIEPMLEPLKFTRLHLFDWVVIGGSSKSTTTPEWTPPFDWLVDLHNQARAAGCKIYHKDNLGFSESMRLKEFPWVDPVVKTLPDEFKYLKGM